MKYQNPSSGSRVVPYGQTDGRNEKCTDMNLIFDFRNFLRVPQKKKKRKMQSNFIFEAVY
jgi:hypothetical protein